jgi:hypothetical protein
MGAIDLSTDKTLPGDAGVRGLPPQPSQKMLRVLWKGAHVVRAGIEQMIGL